MIIWGFRSRNKVMGQIQYICPNCRQNSFHTIVRSSRWFTLFFIPTFSFAKKSISHCNVCGFESVVDNNQADAWFPKQPNQALPPQAQQPASVPPQQYQPYQPYQPYQQPQPYEQPPQ